MARTQQRMANPSHSNATLASSGSPQPVMIQANNLTKRYGHNLVVDDITFSVNLGENVVLLGSSGSGKTTLLKILNRLVEPTSGTVHLNGTFTLDFPPHELRRLIGYVSQQSGLLPHMTVRENMGITPKLLGWPREKIDTRIDELFSLVELDTELGGRLPSELSGGQQQRVGVARALAAKPRVMLLDEPFGALDALTRANLQESFLRIRKALALTSVFVTHDITEALLIADRIGVMRSGRLLQVASPQELLCNPANLYVEQLMTAARQSSKVIEALTANSQARSN